MTNPNDPGRVAEVRHALHRLLEILASKVADDLVREQSERLSGALDAPSAQERLRTKGGDNA